MRKWTFYSQGEEVGSIAAGEETAGIGSELGEVVYSSTDDLVAYKTTGIGSELLEEWRDFGVQGANGEEDDEGRVSVVWLAMVARVDHGYDVKFDGADVNPEFVEGRIY